MQIYIILEWKIDESVGKKNHKIHIWGYFKWFKLGVQK